MAIEWKNGARNGKGVYYYQDGSVYQSGIFKDDQFVGPG